MAIDIIEHIIIVAGKKIDFAVGSMGVVPKFWSSRLYTVGDGSLGKHLNKQKLKTLNWKTEDRLEHMNNLHIKYLKRIGYGIAIGTSIDDYFLDRYDQDYIRALTAYYAGPYSDEMKDLVNNHVTNEYASTVYYSNVFDEKMQKNEAKFGYTWKRTDEYSHILALYIKYHPELLITTTNQ